MEINTFANFRSVRIAISQNFGLSFLVSLIKGISVRRKTKITYPGRNREQEVLLLFIENMVIQVINV